MIEFNIMPRRSGKSTLAHSKYREISVKNNSAIFDQNCSINLESKNFEFLILDNYFQFDDKNKLIISKWYRHNSLSKHIIVYSTADKLYDFAMIKYIKQLKHQLFDIMPIEDMITMFKDEYKDLLTSLLTENGAKFNQFDLEYKLCLSKDKYKTEVLGEIWK